MSTTEPSKEMMIASIRQFLEKFSGDAVSTLDNDSPLFGQGENGAGPIWDSLTMLEIAVDLEESLQVPLLGLESLEAIGTVTALAEYVIGHADADVVSGFLQEWSADGGPGVS